LHVWQAARLPENAHAWQLRVHWDVGRAAKAMSDVYDGTSFQDLVDDYTRMQNSTSFSYSI